MVTLKPYTHANYVPGTFGVRAVVARLLGASPPTISSRNPCGVPPNVSLALPTPPPITRIRHSPHPIPITPVGDRSSLFSHDSVHNRPFRNTMTRGRWRMVLVLAVLALISFLSVGSVDAQGTPCKQTEGPDCDSHATCYTSDRGSFCACNGLYTGNGITCKYSTWRVVVYILGSVIAFSLMFYLCLSCLGYRRNQAQLSSYPMEPLEHRAYGYPPPATTQSSANPAMYAYPAQNGFPVQTGYPVTGFPPQVVNPPTSKVPGPSGTT